MKKILDIIKDSNYSFSLFDQKLIDELEQKITIKDGKPYVVCAIRDKEIVLKPEEIVRQLYAMKLLGEYGYPKTRIKFEHAIHFGREIKSADIVIFDKDRPTVEYIIVEIKKPKLQDGKNQLRSYTNATGAPIAVWTNGGQISHYNRKDPNYFEDITDIPKADQTLEDILKERFTLKDLIIKDKIPNEGKSLKTIIQDMEDEVLAAAGVDVFEEVFKLIFTKLYDELQSKKDKMRLEIYLEDKLSKEDRGDYDKVKEILAKIDDSSFRVLEFRNTGQSEGELKKKIQKLFDEAKAKWPGVFDEASQILLSPSHLSVVVSGFQDIKLFNSNLQIIDEAFEYLVSKSAKGEKGQYFTPRHVIDMCVKMLNPKAGEYMVDTAAGSCGFTVHTIFQITGHLFQNTDISEKEKENVLKVFGIDFDEKVVRVARTLNLIAGDGNTNVLHLNNLDYERWNESIQNRDWLEVYGAGLKRLEVLQKDKSSYKEFNFDILMANPPFAGDIKESRIIHKYDLGYNDKNKPKSKVGRDILFIERNLNFLKPGGRMAIVLPQGRFNNTSDKAIREYIAEKGRILAVVGLHVNTFKPHTGTKTSVLFVQKWDNKLCPKVEDYPIFFAVSEKSGKDNSGEYVFLKNGGGQSKLDKNGHLIIEHDLHNHDGELPDGVAEKFIEWAKSEKLSFWKQL
ncbi:MAG: SAM-dependent methyltransferase [Candidatus Harrisonbacteria bacterium CG10_big_fil_rev_8_21_14_0_10_40_38]|uniref:site-specific DNA-methyltransferase (adenine-specific) n=1 Tax=Candidatus Harrisonbacteria bacterium CG10_big_fil_rev_8_21_14_0_10_40_38 TaxID=1974583 RepID=A0A2H0UT88_9BACT|nr:MAG: SAM-dependent methyltransferase [Candidatus Harrisonbacteria bacterium CG10_big_fil_rev_8_21_14_0_10_40_38]